MCLGHVTWPLPYSANVVGAVMLPRLNEILGDTVGGPYANAQSVLDAADTVRDAVEGVGVLDGLEPELVTEARAVLDAIPAAVDEAILAALESAFERGVPVALEWVQGDAIEVRVYEEPHRTTERVRIVFVSPPGHAFV
jgi:hypothetical protein